MALLANSVVAVPVAGDVMPHSKRQLPQQGIPRSPTLPKQMSIPMLLSNPGLVKDMQPLVDAQYTNTSGRFMGTAEACKCGASKLHGG